MEKENGHDDGCDIRPSRKASTRCRAMLSAFNPCLGFPPFLWFPFHWPFLCENVQSSPRSQARVAERKRQNKLEGSFHLTTAFTAFSKFLHRWSRRKLVMMVLMMTMMIKMKLMIMRTNIVVNEGDEVVVTGDDDSE